MALAATDNTSYTYSPPGQNNSTGSEVALFLKQFGMQVDALFTQKALFIDKHDVRTISNGRSAQFPILGRARNAFYHNKGARIDGSVIAHGERTLVADNFLLNSVFIAEIDELMNHYEVASRYRERIVEGLTYYFDTRIGILLAKAARTAGFIAEQPGGLTGGGLRRNSGDNGTEAASTSIYPTARIDTSLRVDATDPDALENVCYYISKTMDIRELPEYGRRIAFRPAEYYLLVQKPASGANTINPLLNRDYGANGDLQRVQLPMIAKLGVVMTNRVPNSIISLSSEDLAGVATENAALYQGNFLQTVATAWFDEAVGTVKLRDMELQSEYQIERQGTLMVARYAMGHGIMRPECAYEVTDSNIVLLNDESGVYTG